MHDDDDDKDDSGREELSTVVVVAVVAIIDSSSVAAAISDVPSVDSVEGIPTELPSDGCCFISSHVSATPRSWELIAIRASDDDDASPETIGVRI